VGAVPFPEELRPIARVAKRLGLGGEIPDRVLRVAEVKAGEPGLLAAEARAEVEQAILERELEARRPAVVLADDEIHRIVLGQRRLVLAGGVPPGARRRLSGLRDRELQNARIAPHEV